MKQNCWKKKLDYVFARLKESFMQKDEKKNKQKIKAEKAKQKKQELLIFQQRAKYMETYLKKTEKGEKFWIKFKGVDLCEYTRTGNPQPIIEKFQHHQFKGKLLNMMTTKEIPLNKATLYEGLTNWCACGELDMDKDVFANHVDRKHKRKIPSRSQLNRPFWFDTVKFADLKIEDIFCFTLSDLSDYGYPK